MKRKRKIKKRAIMGLAFALGTLSFSTVLALTDTKKEEPIRVGKQTYTQIDRDELIIKYKSEAKMEDIVADLGDKIVDKIEEIRLFHVRIEPGEDLQTQLNRYRKNPNVLYVEPNVKQKVSYISNDPDSSLQWGLNDIGIKDAWEITRGNPNVKIAILDTGVDSDHPDLITNLLAGYNTITNTTNSNDDNGHGTHVASIAAGTMDNGKGVSGIAGNAAIIPVKVLGSNGSGAGSDIIEGILWAANNGADIINMSLGGPGYSQAYQDAINYAYGKGVMIIAAKGNNNVNTPVYPADYNNVLSVSATDQNRNKASFSNYGNVDVAAPGVSIYAATYDGKYGYKQGTSMATPFVAGLAALLLSKDATLSPSEIETLIKGSAVDIGAPGVDEYFGAGLINAAAALNASVDTTPITISNVTTTPSTFLLNGTATTKLSFTLPENGYVSINIYSATNTLVKSLQPRKLLPKGVQSLTWNGRNNSNVVVEEGTYTYEIITEDGAGNQSTPVIGTVIADKSAPVVKIGTPSPQPFVPNEKDVVTIPYELNEAASITGKVYTAAGSLVATVENAVLKESGNQTFSWDGKTSTGAIVNDGTYVVKLESRNLVGLPGSIVSTSFQIKRYNGTLTSVSDSPHLFKATGTSLLTFKYVTTSAGTTTITIYDQENKVIKSLSHTATIAGTYTVTWNGKNDDGNLVGDDIYTYVVKSGSAQEVTGTFQLDKTAPSINGLGISETSSKTNTPMTISFTLSEDSKTTIQIVNNSNALVKTLLSNISLEAGENTIKWDGKATTGYAVDGSYKVVVKSVDYVGFTSNVATQSFTLDRFNPTISKVSDTPAIFKATGTTRSTISYTLSEPMNVTVQMKDANGNTVKTLLENVLQSGTQRVTWDGKGNGDVLLGDGTYSYSINGTDLSGNKATVGEDTIVMDSQAPSVTISEPFSWSYGTLGETRAFGYKLSESAKVTITILNTNNAVVKAIETNISKNAGDQSFSWNGGDSRNYLVQNGTYKYRIVAVDKVGFTTTIVGTFTFTRAF